MFQNTSYREENKTAIEEKGRLPTKKQFKLRTDFLTRHWIPGGHGNAFK